MNLPHRLLLCGLTTALLSASMTAQTPRNPPPWWAVQDEVTVSLYWDFSPPQPLVPLRVAVPTWYNPAVTQGVINGPLQVIPTLTTHVDALGLIGTGAALSATLQMTVDNDPHIDWVKIFWFQFDAFEGATGGIAEEITKQLSKYGRSSVTWDSTPLGGGWDSITMSAELWPQPDDERIDFTFVENAFGNAAIDNLFVNSKCVKIDEADADGEALGRTDAANLPPSGLNLTTLTSRDCQAVAVTEDQAFQRTYWISADAPSLGTQHQVIQLNQTGVPVGVTNLPDTFTTAPNGASDLAVETIRLSPTGHQQFVYALVDLRATPVGALLLRAIDTGGALVAARNVQVQGIPGPAQRFGLCFNPSGSAGTGTFVITDQLGTAYEVDRTGAVLRTFTVPLQTTGAGYDPTFGKYYFFSGQPTATPQGALRVNGHEWSGHDLSPTGVRFWGNLQVPTTGSPGGIAAGIEAYRRLGSGEFRLACVAQTTNGSVLYELHGPFKFGQSIHGITRMQGQPFGGSNNLVLTLEGLQPQTATFASLYAGFSNTAFGPTPLPFNLAGFGFEESQVLVAIPMHSQLLAPQANGQFQFAMPALPQVFSGSRMFFQWLVFDPTVQNNLAMSSAGKTLIY